MAWNEPGGKRRDPWQGGDGSEQPPDLEAMMRRMRERFGGLFGGSPGGLILIIVALLAVWLFFGSVRQIDESQRGVVLRFGKFDRVMGAGLNFKWPAPIETVEVVETTRVRSTSDEVRMLTRDENIVIVSFNVQYQVADPQAYLFTVHDPDETIRQAAESAVRQVIGQSTMDDVLSGEKRAALAIEAGDQLAETLKRYSTDPERPGTGLVVTEFSFPDLQPPPEVKEAFDDAVRAREDKQRLENEAQAYASKVVPEARGQAARVRAEAEGARSAAVAIATGAAKGFELVAEQYKLAPEVTRKRLLLETMQSVLAQNRKVLVEGGGDKVLYLPMDGAAPSMSPPMRADILTDTRAGMSAAPAVEAARTRRDDRDGADR
jgi:membrane protease subunit HflK